MSKLSEQLRRLADEADTGELSKASLARLKRIIAPKKKSKRQTKPRGTKPRKVKPQPERLPALLAIEAGLVCRQYRQVKPGRFEKCQAQAVGFLPGAGDSCDDHKQKPLVRYATARAGSVSKAA